jgi:hypothetical protein
MLLAKILSKQNRATQHIISDGQAILSSRDFGRGPRGSRCTIAEYALAATLLFLAINRTSLSPTVQPIVYK